MRAITQEMVNGLNNGAVFLCYASITLNDNETLSECTTFDVTPNDFVISNNNHYNDGTGKNGFPIGEAICKTIQIELMNDYQQFTTYGKLLELGYVSSIGMHSSSEYIIYYGAKIEFHLKLVNGSNYENPLFNTDIWIGTYTCLEDATYGSTVIITGMDDMWRADNELFARTEDWTVLHMTLAEIYEDACSQCGLFPESTEFLNSTVTIDFNIASEKYTCRQVISYVALMACGNARINEQGYCEIKTYEFSKVRSNKIKFSEGASVSGKTLVITDNGYVTGSTLVLTGGAEIPFESSAARLEDWIQVETAMNPIYITKITAKVETFEYGEPKTGSEEKSEITGTIERSFGTDGYELSVSCPFLGNTEGKIDDTLERISSYLIGDDKFFWKFSGKYISNPFVEFMDYITVVKYDDVEHKIYSEYQSFITEIEYVIDGQTSISNDSNSPAMRAIKFSSSSNSTIQEAKRLIQQEQDEREIAFESLKNAIDNGTFMYALTGREEGDAFYLADRPVLSDAKSIIKITSNGILMSDSGNENYKTALTYDGNAILNRIFANAIEASTVSATDLVIKDESGQIMMRIRGQYTDDFDVVHPSQVYINANLFHLSVTDSLPVGDRLEKTISYVAGDGTDTSGGIIENGVDRFHAVNENGTSYDFTKDGLKVSATVSGEQSVIASTLDHLGLLVERGTEKLLEAKVDEETQEGIVETANIKSRTYLIVGDNCRFENYGEHRTGCFYIGS